MAPLVSLLAAEGRIVSKVCVTAQHRDMLDQLLSVFEIQPDFDLDLMQENQCLAQLSSRAIASLDHVLGEFEPDLLLVQGDTSTTFLASLAAYYRKIPVFHIEAGLRTADIYSPWPEEGNRRMVSVLAKRHFAATEQARANLVREGISAERIELTGNTVIDALHSTKNRIEGNAQIAASLEQQFAFLDANRKMILITAHRREHFGERFEEIGSAIAHLAQEHLEIDFVFPVHPNPNVQEPMHHWLSGSSNIWLLKPLPYLAFVYLFHRSYFVITDSGGIQEEAPALGKPVLLMRDSTERPEAVEAGAVRLVGTNKNNIITHVNELINQPHQYDQMAKVRNLFGDGLASKRILAAVLKELGVITAQEVLHA